jgi:hypothetical protein
MRERVCLSTAVSDNKCNSLEKRPAKNFLSHKHNSIVNKHRQNALMTYSALADAASSEEAKDIVLNHAASCIFSPQETGYIKNESAGNNKSIVELLPKTTMKFNE